MINEKQNAVLLIAGFTQREINDRKIKFHNLFKVWPRLEPRQWVGLTEEEMQSLADKYKEPLLFRFAEFARAIEARLKEQNT